MVGPGRVVTHTILVQYIYIERKQMPNERDMPVLKGPIIFN